MYSELPTSTWIPGETATTPRTTPSTATPTSRDVLAYVADFDRWILPRSHWNHAGHLVVGLVYLERYPLPEALRRIRSAIRGYNEATGGANTTTAGYHESMTRWFLGEIDAWRRAEAPTGGLAARVAALLASPLADPGHALRSYRPEVLFTREARLGWIAPDPDRALV